VTVCVETRGMAAIQCHLGDSHIEAIKAVFQAHSARLDTISAGIGGKMKTRLGPWIFGLLYIAVVVCLILAINFCARRTSSLPLRAVRAHQPTNDRLLVPRRPIRPLPRGVTSPRIA